LGARSGEQGGRSSTVICLSAENSLTYSALIQAPTFSRRHTKTDATQKETAIDQQQHSCETLIYQRHQTILRFLPTATPGSTRWRVRELYCQTWYIYQATCRHDMERGDVNSQRGENLKLHYEIWIYYESITKY
jgi:hypothetical protein